MKFASGIRCPNPYCAGFTYDAMIESGYHAECPNCRQLNRVPGQVMSNDLDGKCQLCGRPLDEHIYGRQTFCCPPQGRRSR